MAPKVAPAPAKSDTVRLRIPADAGDTLYFLIGGESFAYDVPGDGTISVPEAHAPIVLGHIPGASLYGANPAPTE